MFYIVLKVNTEVLSPVLGFSVFSFTSFLFRPDFDHFLNKQLFSWPPPQLGLSDSGCLAPINKMFYDE